LAVPKSRFFAAQKSRCFCFSEKSLFCFLLYISATNPGSRKMIKKYGEKKRKQKVTAKRGPDIDMQCAQGVQSGGMWDARVSNALGGAAEGS
jgi:hypothetical protein